MLRASFGPSASSGFRTVRHLGLFVVYGRAKVWDRTEAPYSTTLVEDGQMKSTSRWPFVVNVPSKLRTEVYSAGIGDYSLQRSHQDEPIFLFCWVGNWITGRHGSRGG